MLTKNEAPTVAGQGRKMRGQAQRLDDPYLPILSSLVNYFSRPLRRFALWILRRHLEGRVHGSFDRRVSSALDCLETLKEVAR